jgi:hypothetical protein
MVNLMSINCGSYRLGKFLVFELWGVNSNDGKDVFELLLYRAKFG